MRTIIILLMLCSTAYAQEGKATWYSVQSAKAEGTSGDYTASGERFTNEGLTCAMRSRAFGRQYRITNIVNGRSIVVKHNDFGPNKTQVKKGVIVDLSPAAFDALGGRRGVKEVRNKSGKTVKIAYGEIKVKVEEIK